MASIVLGLVACAVPTGFLAPARADDEARRPQPVLWAQVDPSLPAFGQVEARGFGSARPLDDARLVVRALELARSDSVGRVVAEMPPLLGRTETSEAFDGTKTLAFTPRFPPAPGLVLHARLELGEQVLEAQWQLPEAPSTENPPTVVEGVEPCAGGIVPANLLRFYVHFSAPMLPVDVARHVHLLDADGAEIPLAFVEISNGLWDPSRRRLTLWVHPGRIKRGVGPHEVLGPVLTPGDRVTLRLDGTLRDAAGRELASAFEQHYLVGPADRRAPDPTNWTLASPAPGQLEARIDFGETLDPALAARMIELVDADERPIVAHAVVESDAGCAARGLRFALAEPWRGGKVAFRVDAAIEDLAGNRVDGLFEQALGGRD